MSEIHAAMMARAIELAKFGDPSPNPHVGCVVAWGDAIVGEGYHESAGCEHAEIAAIHGLAARLSCDLAGRDPLSERVHLGKAAFAVVGGFSALRYLVSAILRPSRPRSQVSA